MHCAFLSRYKTPCIILSILLLGLIAFASTQTAAAKDTPQLHQPPSLIDLCLQCEESKGVFDLFTHNDLCDACHINMSAGRSLIDEGSESELLAALQSRILDYDAHLPKQDPRYEQMLETFWDATQQRGDTARLLTTAQTLLAQLENVARSGYWVKDNDDSAPDRAFQSPVPPSVLGQRGMVLLLEYSDESSTIETPSIHISCWMLPAEHRRGPPAESVTFIENVVYPQRLLFVTSSLCFYSEFVNVF